VKDYDDMSKDTTVDFVITLHKGKLEELESCILENDCNGLEKQFRLFSTLSTTNMHLFDAHDKLKKYANVVDIIEDYYETRIVLYQTRKDYMMDMLSRELLVLSNKTRYIKENLEGTIDLRRKSREVVNQMLTEKQYSMINDDSDYKYLTELPMNSVTEEKVEQLEKQHESKKMELELLRETSIEQMWFRELELLENEYIKYKNEFTGNVSSVVSKNIPAKTKPNPNPQRKLTSTSMFVIPPSGDVKKAKKPKQSELAGGNKL
jgi:DNA topoisomerase-2